MAPTQLPKSGNPLVFFDITLGGEPLGRIKFELFADVVPRQLKTSGNSAQEKPKITWAGLKVIRAASFTES